MWVADRDEPVCACVAGERYVLQQDIEKARAEAGRAGDELKRGGATEEFGGRLAALEAAISAASKALEWRQKARDELGAASRCLELVQVLVALFHCDRASGSL